MIGGSMRLQLLTLGLALSLVGACAQLQEADAESQGNLLREAGFRMVPASTPARIEELRALQPEVFSQVSKDGQSYWVFADPEGCSCLYVGGQAQLETYQRLDVEAAYGDYPYAELDWGVWGFDPAEL